MVKHTLKILPRGQYKIFKVCIVIFQHHAWKGENYFFKIKMSFSHYCFFLFFLFLFCFVLLWKIFVLKVDSRVGWPDRLIFSLKRQTVQFLFLFNLYFPQKRVLKLSICHWLTKSSVWVCDVTNRRNGFYNFQRYH